MASNVDFMVDGWRYVWAVTDQNQIAFCLQESNYKTRLVPNEELMIGWGDDDIVTTFENTGICRKPVEVLRRVADLTLKWIKTSKPTYFWIQASNDKKRHLYRRMIARFGKEVLTGFQIVEYDEAIYFYKDTTLAKQP